ncbi:MAG TPA: hypothetical protein VK308_06210 [Pyrinomonadaceae bacterium]|nr:hypothetical protein [Pyrinomonadaceae bacterium]
MLKHIGYSLLLIFAVSISAVQAQEDFNGRSLSGIKADFKSVGMVAHVKIKSIEPAASELNPLYRVESETLETFKGKAKKGESLIFYFSAEEGYDVRKLTGKQWIVFLDVERPMPSGGKAWFELENSKLTVSKKLVGELRKLKKPARKG